MGRDGRLTHILTKELEVPEQEIHAMIVATSTLENAGALFSDVIYEMENHDGPMTGEEWAQLVRNLDQVINDIIRAKAVFTTRWLNQAKVEDGD